MKMLATVLLLSAGAAADLKYTTKTTSSSGLEQTTVIMIKGRRQREESTKTMGPLQAKFTTLTWCDQKQRVLVDDDLKIYSVRPIGVDPPQPGEDQGKGTLETHYTVMDKGKERIKNLDTRHWIIRTRYRGTGSAGRYNLTENSEVWIAALPGLNCPERWRIHFDNAGIKSTASGDVTDLQRAYQGMLVKRTTEDSTTELVHHSTATLPDSLFRVSEDYQKLPLMEFRRRLQHKLTGQRRGLPSGRVTLDPGHDGELARDYVRNFAQTPGKCNKKVFCLHY